MIWKNPIKLDELNNAPEYMGTFLGIKFTEWNDTTLIATMPVNKKLISHGEYCMEEHRLF